MSCTHVLRQKAIPFVSKLITEGLVDVTGDDENSHSSVTFSRTTLFCLFHSPSSQPGLLSKCSICLHPKAIQTFDHSYHLSYGDAFPFCSVLSESGD